MDGADSIGENSDFIKCFLSLSVTDGELEVTGKGFV